MIEKSVPATRELRGIRLYRERGDEIVHEGRGVYTVPGCSGGTYRVDLAVFGEGEESCNCPDRAPVCKHIICATIHRAKVGAARRTRRPALSPETVAANLALMEA